MHDSLMQDPRRAVAADELNHLKDQDARDNYAVLLRFRDRLPQAETVEGCYMSLFKGGVDVPPLFIEQLAHVVLRNIDRKSTRLNSSHIQKSRMPSSA